MQWSRALNADNLSTFNLWHALIAHCTGPLLVAAVQLGHASLAEEVPRRASACPQPHAIETMPSSPGSLCGCADSVMPMPCPSCPRLLVPQLHTLPCASTAKLATPDAAAPTTCAMEWNQLSPLEHLRMWLRTPGWRSLVCQYISLR